MNLQLQENICSYLYFNVAEYQEADSMSKDGLGKIC